MSKRGHQASPLEISEPVDSMIKPFRASCPDLVFNVAEGIRAPRRDVI